MFLQKNNSQANLLETVTVIKNGGIVAFPTETVYGIGANIFNENAVKKIFEIKGRSFAKPLSAHISDIEMVAMVACSVPEIFYKLADIFLPGALTLIVPAKPNVPVTVTANSGSIAIRFPKNQLCKKMIDLLGFPLAATSANISGQISATNAEEVKAELFGKIDAIVDGGECELKQESTVINLLKKPSIVRIGAITVQEIEEKLGKKIF